ncbi:GatB/GatE catalytic domain-containing protein, partial [Usnea florida]
MFAAKGQRLATSSLRSRTNFQWQALRITSLQQQWSIPIPCARSIETEATQPSHVPFRKQLKDEAKRRREAQRLDAGKGKAQDTSEKNISSKLNKWKLTVGLEIHAQLNTERKLFSEAKTSEDSAPNSNIAFFDLALPGTQPKFQKATLLPALRAALGLNCKISQRSHFDRKHYYYQDQPAGYQITQFYSPFAAGGNVLVYDHDGIAPEDGQLVDVAIKQIQLEQDTAKSNLEPPSTILLDFNRVGHPLIEIITHPQIHHPQTAVACVRKIQSILQASNAVTTGMELGGLRVDVNVSVSHKGSDVFGQRTEIKNLNSFKAVEDAITAERDRQIEILESGGSIEGETRGWTLGSTETKKLRGKEGEVDYRYMPDPDIPPLVIGQDLIDHIGRTLPQLPEETITNLTTVCELTIKDAKSLMSLDNGERLDYFDTVRTTWASQNPTHISTPHLDKMVANWSVSTHHPKSPTTRNP